MIVGLALLYGLAASLSVALIMLLVRWPELSDRINRRRNVKRGVSNVADQCNRIWSEIHDDVSCERRRCIREPFGRHALENLYEQAAAVGEELRHAVRTARSSRLETAESVTVQLSSLARRFESVVRHIAAVDVSTFRLRAKTLALLDATETYRSALSARVDALQDRGVCLGRERRVLIGFANLIRMHRDRTDNGAIDRLHRLSGMLIVLNTINMRVLAAEEGRPVRWRSYRKDRRALKGGVDEVSLARTMSRERDWRHVGFMTRLLVGQADRMRASALRLSGTAYSGMFSGVAKQAIREFMWCAAYTRVYIRDLEGCP